MEEKECELFKMTPKELVEAKLYTLQKMRLKQAEIIELNYNIKSKERDLLLKVDDLKKMGLPSDKLRAAYVEKKLEFNKKQLEWLKHDEKKFNDDLTLIDDLLKLENGDD